MGVGHNLSGAAGSLFGTAVIVTKRRPLRAEQIGDTAMAGAVLNAALRTLTALIAMLLAIPVADGIVPSARSWATVAPEESVAMPPAFRLGGFHPLPIDPAAMPYVNSRTPRRDGLPHDSTGVRMVRIHGRLRDHPRAQAVYGIENLERYRSTHDAFFLRRAVAQADRLISRRVVSRGAWFYPYSFDFELHRGLDRRTAPWFSAMAQGQTTSLFVRLAAATGERRWSVAAAATFRSLLLLPKGSAPWVSQVVHGELWLEEYPARVPSRSDFTLNGHIFAMYGLYDYWAFTGSPVAARLFDGAATTVARRLPAFRRPGWRSRYCLQHGADAVHYHNIHVTQLLRLHQFTGSQIFARYADLLRDDYTLTTRPGTVHLPVGTVVGHRFDTAGRVVATRSLTLRRASLAASDRRESFPRRGAQLRINSGPLSGYWVSEIPGRVFRTGSYAGLRYLRPRTVATTSAPVDGFELHGPSGRPVAVPHTPLTRGARMTVDASAYLDGLLHVRITSGPLTSRWVPMRQLTWR